MKKLYFIALIPPEDVLQQVRQIKEEIAERFLTTKALKLPAHITLEAPFHFLEKDESHIFQSLEKVAERQEGFEVKLEGFGAFSPKTIFLKVENWQPVEKLFFLLQKELENSIKKESREKKEHFHPHMTVAFRDLSPKMFTEAWEEYKEREFSTPFKAQSLFLLKHNGKIWEIYKDSLF